MTRLLWTALGGIALCLGVIGVVLPILPTTPFVILAAFAFARGSTTVHDWLLSHRTFGPIIADWRSNGAIAPRHKAMAVVMMVAAFCVSLALGAPMIVLVVQSVCMSAAAAFILTRPG